MPEPVSKAVWLDEARDYISLAEKEKNPMAVRQYCEQAIRCLLEAEETTL